jgi:hypothetical protein
MSTEFAQDQGKNREMVGYGRPPRATRFRPGRSGNPAGRPKGQSITALLCAAIQAEVDGRTAAERIAEVMVGRALKGDIRFVREILDRTEGKVPKQVADSGSEVTRIKVVYTDDWRGRSDDQAGQPGPVKGGSALGDVPDADFEAVANGEARLSIDGNPTREWTSGHTDGTRGSGTKRGKAGV